MSEPALGIYVHWPYCAAICPYCDFNVYRDRGDDRAGLRAAIIQDMRAHAQRFGKRRAQSLYFGGGTPSLLCGADIAAFIAAACDSFELAPDAEITLEANPEDWPRFAELRDAGVNRFSIGAQAFDNAALKALGRFHDVETTTRAIHAAADTGARVSLDLIYAREGQGIDDWGRELRRALALPIEHLSLYQLTIEPGTSFARKHARGQLVTPDNDAAADFYEATQDICATAGFPAYEISNHARAPEARSIHNLLYWRCADWVGLGPGAHGRITHRGARFATEAHRRPADYIEAVRLNAMGWLQEAELTHAEQADELLIMGLRVEDGIDIARLEALHAAPLKHDKRDWLVEQGLLHDDAARLRLTARGRLLANQVAAELAI